MMTEVKLILVFQSKIKGGLGGTAFATTGDGRVRVQAMANLSYMRYCQKERQQK